MKGIHFSTVSRAVSDDLEDALLEEISDANCTQTFKMKSEVEVTSNEKDVRYEDALASKSGSQVDWLALMPC